jgi:hypothetical protein
MSPRHSCSVGVIHEIRSNNDIVYRCTSRVCWCVEYRRKATATLWTNSCFGATVGGTSLEIIM